jgi:hypothetical protein
MKLRNISAVCVLSALTALLCGACAAEIDTPDMADETVTVADEASTEAEIAQPLAASSQCVPNCRRAYYVCRAYAVHHPGLLPTCLPRYRACLRSCFPV